MLCLTIDIGLHINDFHKLSNSSNMVKETLKSVSLLVAILQARGRQKGVVEWV